ncbi:hypothetical protein [Desulfobacter latus]|uniref:SNF7 family protein n=1 Tax=Desulfobacter latus TaxID=2292 RepID=A0A850T733_9BACT|nr:hypothetical protein [Desulfobacter latus]NWH04825.1 hypothetical protein [Desulfobacter latus]
MGLFESKEVKRAKREVAIRMAQKKVAGFVAECRKMAGKYTELAKRALALDRQAQCDQYLMQRLQYEQQAKKWDAFLLRMEDLSMRGQMSNAMTGILEGIQSLNRELRAGVSVKSMTKAITELNVSKETLGQAELQLSSAMEQMDFDLHSEDDGMDYAIPVEMAQTINSLRSELLDEVAIQEMLEERHG